jgi:integrase/recombinase XerD
MFQELFSSESARRRHGDAPYAIERERYLPRCAEQGATRATLRMKAKELLWLAQHLEADASEGVDMESGARPPGQAFGQSWVARH